MDENEKVYSFNVCTSRTHPVCLTTQKSIYELFLTIWLSIEILYWINRNHLNFYFYDWRNSFGFILINVYWSGSYGCQHRLRFLNEDIFYIIWNHQSTFHAMHHPFNLIRQMVNFIKLKRKTFFCVWRDDKLGN